MIIEVKIPALGESISSGIISSWHVKNGDIVSAGQVLYDLETDKITSEGHAETGGKISLLFAEGAEVKIGQAIATIDTAAQAAQADAPVQAQPKIVLAEKPISPAVRRIAEETHINPNTVTGTGKDNRVTKGDMIQAAQPAATPSSPAAKAPCQSSVCNTEKTSRKKMTPLRAKIAERLVQSQRTSAILTTFNEVDMQPVMDLRKKYQDEFTKKHGVKLGFMSFFIKASIHALQEVPAINAQIDGDYIVQNHYFDIGVAVGGPKGLVVPVLRDCDNKDFHTIEQDLVDYAKRARDGKISIDDMQGGVFTISNGGIYGSMLSTPIINPPQSAILGMHAIKDRAVVINGQIVIRPMMYLALSYDHRLVDGKEAVTFLNKIKDAIEDPSRLLFNL